MGGSKKKSRTTKSYINKYTLTIIGFLVWMTFFDQYNLIGQYKMDRVVDRLEQERVDYKEKMEDAQLQQKVMERDIERFAREKHYMHKENEEVIIIERSQK